MGTPSKIAGATADLILAGVATGVSFGVGFVFGPVPALLTLIGFVAVFGALRLIGRFL